MADLTLRTAHFDFGENWASYSGLIDSDRVQQAIGNVEALAGPVAGKSFLDIGCGSGLFSLAASRLGAAGVTAIDIDERSVATATALLTNHGARDWNVREQSVFDLGAEQFDIVYSWGVLHHTGDMWRAIERAAAAVKPGGTFAFALYEKTPLCRFWRIEKRLYRRAPRFVQGVARIAFEALQMTARLAAFRSPLLRREGIRRGMDYSHDLHDWLGGYPYESTSIAEVEPFMRALGFEKIRNNQARVKAKGIGGSPCSEYVFRRL